MRVVGGRCKGLRLATFKGRSIRPTSDKVREAVFSILAGRVEFEGKSVLDLFAGTGAMGIEALSRGAEKAVFVDVDRGAVEIVRKNLDACDLAARSRVLKRDFKGALSYLSKRGDRFDLVFIDPPYNSPITPAALEGLHSSGVLNPGGIVVVETSKRRPMAVGAGGEQGYSVVDERRYGETLVYLLTQGA
jgi:16S rRNA (guanine966-N2)-methyltransferase